MIDGEFQLESADDYDDDFELAEASEELDDFDDDESEAMLAERIRGPRGRRIAALERARSSLSAGIRRNAHAIQRVNRRVTTTWRRATGNLRTNRTQHRDIKKLQAEQENFRTMSLLTSLMLPDETLTLKSDVAVSHNKIPANTSITVKRKTDNTMMQLLPLLMGTSGGSGGDNMMLMALVLSQQGK